MGEETDNAGRVACGSRIHGWASGTHELRWWRLELDKDDGDLEGGREINDHTTSSASCRLGEGHGGWSF
jgi:hypothetical protein